MKLFLPTMSRTDLLLACPWPWGRDGIQTAWNPAMVYGTNFHGVLANKLDPKIPLKPLVEREHDETEPTLENISSDASRLEQAAESAKKVLLEWLDGGNQYGINIPIQACLIEKALAWHPESDTARFCKTVDDEHNYPDRKPGELCGTFDVACDLSVIVGMLDEYQDCVLILDHKTGYDLPKLTDNEQLLSLACAFAKLKGKQRAIVALLHAPHGQDAGVYSDIVDIDELEAHRNKVRQAMSLIGKGFMRPGPQCLQCPAASICDARGNMMTQAIVVAAKSPAFKTANLKLDLTVADDRGQMHMLLQTYEKVLYALKQELKAKIEEYGPGSRTDGKLSEIVPVPRTNLSQASIMRALGPIEGKAVLDELEEKGCIEHNTRYELRATRDRG